MFKNPANAPKIKKIINPNGLRIDSPGNGTATWTLGTAGIQYEFVYFVSTRSTSEWIVRETAT